MDTVRMTASWTAALVDTSASSSSGFSFNGNSTSASANQLEFAAAKSIRMSTVILASFNAMAGLATAVGIYWDCYRTARRDNPTLLLKSVFWRMIGPTQTFPFVLSGGIMAQGIVFAFAQSKGLWALQIIGCSPLSQAMLPGEPCPSSWPLFLY